MYSLNKISKAISLIALTLGCFGLSPQARAICQEGCLTDQNTVLGEDALLNNTGFSNTATGYQALFRNTTGNFNTASGWAALMSNTTGFNNTANGADALSNNTTGGGNTAIGTSSLSRNTTGLNNTANGGSALLFNTTGTNNTASGWGALFENQTGIGNVALGVSAAKSTNGNFNTASGFEALFSNTGGSNNTATGHAALYYNTGNNNIAIGQAAGIDLTTGSDNIDIGNAGVAGESGIIRIGTAGTQTATFIAGIRETPLAQGVAMAVGITADGQLGVRASSARFKEAIKPMDKASEAIFSLRPVTFRYKKALDPEALLQFGLVAEQVEKVNPDLVVRDAEGKPYTVRYEAVNAMLLNEFLKAHRQLEEETNKNQAQEATIGELKATLTRQEREIQNLTTNLRKISDDLALRKPTPRLVTNDR